MDLRATEHEFLLKDENPALPNRVKDRFETPDRTVKDEVTSSLPMLSLTQLSPMLTPEPPSPKSEVSNYGDDMEVPVMELATDIEHDVYVKIKPSSPTSSAQTNEASAGIKRDLSMVDKSPEVIPETPKRSCRT